MTALLAAILSDPADDLPRLCFADWLDENGESERAEFIRVQVELARIGEFDFTERNKKLGHQCHADKTRDELRRREYALLASWQPGTAIGTAVPGVKSRARYAWAGPAVASLDDPDQKGWKWSRGFVASVRLSWADWLHHHEALYWHPKQTVECPACNGRGGYDEYRGIGEWDWASCPPCESTGRIHRPFVATAQPITEVELTTAHQITEVELTTWPVWDSSTHHVVGYLDENGRGVDFTRVKCPACGGKGHHVYEEQKEFGGLSRTREACGKCHGEPLNKWTCDRWPTITFKMP